MKGVYISFIFFSLFFLQTNAQDTLLIFPDEDAELRYTTRPGYTYYQTTNYGSTGAMRSMEWTTSGYPYKIKSLIGIDLSGLPSNAFIVKANLYLYSNGHINYNTTLDSGYKSNASYLRRVTTGWSENDVTWSMQPNTTSDNQVLLADSDSANQDYVVDVTNLIKDIRMRPTSSYGLMLSLETAEKYTLMYFASSDYTSSEKHPVLEVIYSTGLYTNFEGFEGTETKWDNISGDSIDWDLKSGSTPSIGTGPSGAFEGEVYAYIEATGNYPNKSAILQSEELYLPEVDNALISFNYHMYGAEMGSLSFELSTDHGAHWSQLWSISGNQEDEWHQKTIDLSSFVGETLTLRFVGETGTYFRSDICVDNINIMANRSADVSSDENYIYTRTPYTENGLSGLTGDNVQYFDGLGRANQNIEIWASPKLNDVITPIVYNRFGRIEREYLPYSASDNKDGAFRDFNPYGDNVLQKQETFYQLEYDLGIFEEPFAYGTTIYEQSTLGRSIEIGAPGEDFTPDEETQNLSEHVTKLGYGTNQYGEVRCFSVNSSGNLTNTPTYYDSRALSKNSVEDPDGNLSVEFIDKNGNVVLKRSYIDTDSISTYYVYDDLGLLRYIIPPKALGDNGVPTSSVLSTLCYKYEYDSRKRMIMKKLPGVSQVDLVYDNRDRLVGTRDGELDDLDSWIFIKYDKLNRAIMTCKVKFATSGLTQAQVQGYIDDYYDNNANNYCETYSGSGTFGYTDISYPVLSQATESVILTINYYDDYSFLNLTGFSSLSFDNTNNIDAYEDNSGVDNGYVDYVNGQITGSAILILDNSDSNYIRRAHYYDNKYRQIQQKNSLYPSGFSTVSSHYDFVGKTTASLEIQTVNGISNTILYQFNYDHANRLTDTYVTVNSDDKLLLSRNVYNELGQVKSKMLHSSNLQDFTQCIDYSYNMRGWMTEINDVDDLASNDDLFAMNLYYNDLEASLGSEKTYNGNISGIRWAYDGNDTINAYTFAYDDLNRITATDYKVKPGSSWLNPTSFETTYSYDKNGNLLTLTRKDSNGSLIDNLTYNYLLDGNQLDNIVDSSLEEEGVSDNNTSGSDYTYDLNGNMYQDNNKDLKLKYNYLNRPSIICEDSGTGDSLLYIYDAMGTKWIKKINQSSTILRTLYAGSFVYENSSEISTEDFDIKYIINPVGKINLASSSPDYSYFIKDHLGNIRVEFDTSGTKMQYTDYYPFGMTSKKYSIVGDNKYLYNAKELQNEQLGGVNLDWYDYGARFYDPVLGRWHVPDPVAEFASPYVYVGNNPTKFLDPFGLYGQDGSDDNPMSPKVQLEGMYIPFDLSDYLMDSYTTAYYFSVGSRKFSQFKGEFGSWQQTGYWTFPTSIERTVGTYNLIMKWISSDVLVSQRLLYACSGGDRTERAGNILTVTGSTFHTLEGTVVYGDRWLGNNGKYYSKNWGGNQYTGSRAGAYKAAGIYKAAGRANVAATVMVGGVAVYNGYQQDGGQFGYNANRAGASATGGLVGGWAGAEAGAVIGASIGVWFGGVGAAPGALIGGFIGGFVGSLTGSHVGGTVVDDYYNR